MNLQAQISEKSFREILTTIINNVRIPERPQETIKTDYIDLGNFRLAAEFAFNLKVDHPDKIDLKSDNSFVLPEVTIHWETLNLWLGITIPAKICIPGKCLLSVPFVGCVAKIPEYCVFQKNVEFDVAIPLQKALRASEVTIRSAISPVLNGKFWELRLKNVKFDIDPIDFEDGVKTIWHDTVRKEVTGKLKHMLPDKLVDWLAWLADKVINLIAEALDLGDDLIKEKLVEWFGMDGGLLGLIADLVVRLFFSNKLVAAKIDNPLKIMGKAKNPNGSGELIPVKMVIKDMAVNITNENLTLSLEV